jgi:glutathione S-transferase
MRSGSFHRLSGPCKPALLAVAVGVVLRCRSATVSDEFDSLDATEKAATKAALNRCRAVAAKIESELRNKKPEHFVDKLSLADFYASLERAADVLGQESRKSVENTPAPAR